MQSDGLKNLEVLLIDIDHVVHHYDATYAREFSTATVQSFLELHPDKADRYDFDDLVEKAVQSYCDHGRTTAWFTRHFKIDEMELYQHHHDAMCEEGGFIAQQFQSGAIKIAPELPSLIQKVKDKGVKVIFVTNGTQGYGEMVLGERGHGIAHLADGVYGIDSVDNPYLYDKRHGVFIADILEKTNLKKEISELPKGDTVMNYSHIGMLDDTNRNLRASRKAFNMHTTLQVNNPDWRGVTYANEMTHSFPDYLRRIIAAKTVTQFPELTKTA